MQLLQARPYGNTARCAGRRRHSNEMPETKRIDGIDLLRGLFILLAVFIAAGPFARTRHFNPNPVWREYSYFGGMDAIAMGCLTAILLSHRRLSRSAQLLCGYTGTAILIFILGLSSPLGN